MTACTVVIGAHVGVEPAAAGGRSGSRRGQHRRGRREQELPSPHRTTSSDGAGRPGRALVTGTGNHRATEAPSGNR